VMADSQDWYRFTTTAAGSSSNTVSISFQNSQGNLQLALYNSSGTLVGTSQGTGNSESISLNGLAAGTYYALAYGNAGALNPNYSLTVTAPTTPTTTTTTTTTPTSTGGFQITLSMAGLTASQQAIFQQAAARWQQVITGDLPNATYRGQTVDDILINASATSIDGVNGILGQAGPDAFRSGSLLPYHGIMQFDSADMASMESSGLLFSVILHEMGHVLGIGTIWEDKGLLSGAGTSNPIFVGAQATAAYNQMFGTSARGVPVENTGGAGTADGHWRETIFTNELMTGWAGPGTNLPLSRVTVASLADLGYTVNMAAADSYTPTSSARSLAATAARSSSSLLAYTDASTTADALTTSLAAITSPTARPFARSLNAAESPLTADLVDYLMASSSDDHANDDASFVERSSAAAESSNPWHDLALTDNAFLALPQLQA
jgi:Leishmanolysin/Bacterial pre-peptidase C-terminal domain